MANRDSDRDNVPQFDSRLHNIEADDKARLADNWFAQFLQGVQRVVERNHRSEQSRVKVAILDTGIKEQDEEIQAAIQSGAIRLENCKGFPDTEEFDPVRDPDGHGTHGACVLLKTAPNIELFVARVFNNQLEMSSADNREATAFKWAIENKVDIISLSWSLSEEVSAVKEILSVANSKGILIFAAAGNDGQNKAIPFPASLNFVFCVGATDGFGNRRDFSPWEQDLEIYGTLGEAVSAANDPDKPCKCNELCFSHRRLNGTSTATPIAAGIAALLIEYTRSLKDPTYDAGNRENMRKLFLEMSKGASAGSFYRYLTPWRLGNLSDRSQFRESVQKILRSPIATYTLGRPLPFYEYNVNGYNLSGNYNEAKSMCEQALRVTPDELGKTTSRVSFIKKVLGLSYFSLGHYDQSISEYEGAVAIFNFLGNTHYYDMVETRCRIATLYVAEGKYAEAKEIVGDYAAGYHPEAPWLREFATRIMGDALVGMYQYEEAASWLQTSLQFCTSSYHADNIYTTYTQISVARFYYLTRKFTEARALLNSVLSTVSRLSTSSKHINAASAIELLANVKLEENQVSESIEDIENVLLIYDKFVGPRNIRSYFARTSLGRAYAKRGDYDQALANHKDALKIVESVFKKDHILSAEVMKELGLVYVEMDSPKEGRKWLLRAEKVFITALGDGIPPVAQCREAMAKLTDV